MCETIKLEAPALVQIDAAAVLRMAKHANSAGAAAAGPILGVEEDKNLVVTGAFVLPSRNGEESEGAENEQYQLDMLKSLKAVNQDSNIVGWFCCAPLSSCMGDAVVEIQIEYQMFVNRAVMVLFNADAGQTCGAPVKAFRLSDGFIEHYLSLKKLGPNDRAEQYDGPVYEQIPVQVVGSVLLGALVDELEDANAGVPAAEGTAVLESYLRQTSECLEDMAADQMRLMAYERQQRQALSKKDDPAKPKAQAAPPNHVGAFLIAAQTQQFVSQLTAQV